MKRTLLLALALIAVGCADPIPRNLDGLVQQGGTYLDRETMRPYSGPVFRFLPNDTTRVQLSANLKDGKYDGPFEMYHENGQLQSRSTANMGEIDGPAEGYDEQGQLKEKGSFDMSEKCGEWIEDGETVTFDPCPPGLEDGN